MKINEDFVKNAQKNEKIFDEKEEKDKKQQKTCIITRISDE